MINNIIDAQRKDYSAQTIQRASTQMSIQEFADRCGLNIVLTRVPGAGVWLAHLETQTNNPVYADTSGPQCGRAETQRSALRDLARKIQGRSLQFSILPAAAVTRRVTAPKELTFDQWTV